MFESNDWSILTKNERLLAKSPLANNGGQRFNGLLSRAA